MEVHFFSPGYIYIHAVSYYITCRGDRLPSRRTPPRTAPYPSAFLCILSQCRTCAGSWPPPRRPPPEERWTPAFPRTWTPAAARTPAPSQCHCSDAPRLFCPAGRGRRGGSTCCRRPERLCALWTASLPPARCSRRGSLGVSADSDTAVTGGCGLGTPFLWRDLPETGKTGC